MIERGFVVSVEGDQVSIRCLPQGCASCGSGGLCARDGQNHVVRALNRTGRSLLQGDEVEMYIRTGRAMLSGFLVLILPLVMFFPFYYLAGALPGLHSEPLQVGAGLIGVTLGILSNLLWARNKKTQELPEIIRLIDRDAPQAVHPDS